MDIVYLDFSKALDTISHNVPTDKLSKCGKDEGTAGWIEKWLNSRSQRVTVTAQGSSGGLSLCCPHESILGLVNQ